MRALAVTAWIEDMDDEERGESMAAFDESNEESR
jgi:hypothetical protein